MPNKINPAEINMRLFDLFEEYVYDLESKFMICRSIYLVLLLVSLQR